VILGPSKATRKVMRKRAARGSSFIEAICIATVLIPITLVLLDCITIVIANSMNDTAAKNAARAAASQEDGGNAALAAEKAIAPFKKPSPIINSLSIKELAYGADTVSCTTTIDIHLPMPFPGYTNLKFDAKDIEPIVGKKVNP